MKNYRSTNLLVKFLLGILICATTPSFGQIEVEPTGVLFTPESLITNVFLGEGVEVTNLTFEGANEAVGLFTNGMDDIGIDRGIILSSGDVNLIPDFATTLAAADNTSIIGADGDLNPIVAPNDIFDVSRYEITFIPTSDTLQFRYVFTSEEYPNFTCSTLNDVFGFFLTGPNPNGGMYDGENIALIPDPADPTGLTFTPNPVTINNVNADGINPPNCNFDYSQYYNNNAGSNTLVFGAYLDVFVAQAVVVPCQEYTIKLAIADAGDPIYDTGVFLEAKSFGTGSLEVEFASLSLDGTITEDCASAVLTFETPNQVEADFPLDYTIIGTAENGVDYQTIPPDLFIPAGDTSVSVDVIAWEDGIPEGVESIGIDIQRDPCNRDTFWLFVRDNEILPPDLGPDLTTCQSDSVQLDGTLPIPLPDPPSFSNDTDLPIITISNNNPPPPGTLPTQSEIQVFGVQPVNLEEGVIQSVCIDIDHPWDSDIDVFLVAPNGQFIELTTDNGGGGDDYIGTCFTPVSTQEINFGSQAPNTAPPFTGDWSPEGEWDDLWTIQDPLTNGVWTLQIKDDQDGFSGTLLNWSITFNPLYQIFYEWTPSNGLSCADCATPMASPDTTTTYYLEAFDTYGCTVYDTITVNIIEQLPPPDVSCSNITNSSIDFCWPALTGASGYEVNVDDMGWIPANNGLCHTVTGLTLEDTVTIQVLGLGTCSGMIDTITCWTPSCTPPTANILTQTDADCFGASTGSVTVEAMGLFPPFEYSIIGVDTNSTGFFDGLAAGAYTVLVLDDLSCPQSVPVTIGEPSEIMTTGVLVNNASCNGGADGSITVEVTGGTTPYSFSWSNGQSDSIATLLSIGEYYVTVQDFNNCSVIDTVEVTQPPVMNLTIEMDSVSCNGAGDGTATVMVMGGVGPHSYQWDAATSNQTTPTAVGLNGGNYTVTVTDQNMCSDEISIDVIENAAITLMMTNTDVSCFNGMDGTAGVIASGGSGAYTYQWSDPNTQTSDVAFGLGEGLVSVIVTDSDGCFTTGNVTLNQPTQLNASFQQNNVFCNGGNDGEIILIVNGGTPGFTYEWSDDPSVTDSVRNDLIAGDYEVTVTDANTCVQILNITLDQPNAIDLPTTVNNASCNGAIDGTAAVNPTGGATPFSFQWDANANNQTSQLATSLGAGTYLVTVTDNNMCTSETSVEVMEPAVLELTNTSEDVLCFGNSTGEIDLDIQGGTMPYDVVWTGPNSYNANTEDINTLFSGMYNVVVTDANMCSTNLSVNIDQPTTGIMSTISEPDSICFAAGTGAVSVSVGGGTGPFSYEWSNGMTNPNLTGLDDGIYIVTITDSGSCTFVDTARVVEAEEITVSLAQTGTLCHDGDDGTASVVGIQVGGTNTSLADYSLFWDNGGQTTTTINSLTGGQSYAVTVTDTDGCTGTSSIEVDNPEEIDSRIDDIRDVSCFSGNDGEATAVGLGGVGPYEYLWDAAANNQITALATELSVGTYTVTITDSNGCETVMTADIAEPSRLEVDFSVQGTDCFGDPSGEALAMVLGGTPGYSYSWSNGGTDARIESVPGGIYTVTITDANGCTFEENTEITQPDELTAQIDAVDVDCFEGRNGEILFLPAGGTPPYQYSLDGINYNGSDLQIALTAGSYPAYIRDVNGCETFLGDYMVNQPDEILVDLGETVLIDYGSFTQLNPTVTGGLGNLTFNYNLEDTISLSCVNCPNPNASPEFTTFYELLVTDANGCSGEATLRVVVEKNRPLYVPTGFSPNGDNINDILRLYGRQIAEVKAFRVFDRWGEMVFETLDYVYDPADDSAGWDGTFKGQEMNPGVYLWHIELVYIDGTTGSFQGNTTLIR